ncbi:rhodanese-like domain-containing protein [Spartinivicinus poritis]|uniref:Rhodanese-like domain-containing protein n=1 Tax=Spartinivicinus poritis TaxID=2994640 RepID=A0ABT5UC65_9GAMM|nr:rhodanese-like domain-containing protein [Spartinivicinus sp. A2-2]MDE1463968.1 rhodanese-like domain-containing protein [Spartinivicinus sp. A2-2]
MISLNKSNIKTTYFSNLPTISLLLLSLFTYCNSYANHHFPHREKYKDVEVISTQELHKNYNSCLIIDVRSSVEFDVIHIKNAINISLGNRNFINKVKSTYQQSGKACVVFYCNGHSCEKSYKAVRKIGNEAKPSYAYDSGIFDWAQDYNHLTMLLDKTLDNKNKLISPDEYSSALMEKEHALARQNSLHIIDIRDSFQRTEDKIPFKARKRIPLSRIIPLLKRRIIKDNNLLFIDKVGKQNRWLHYYLKEYGYKNYSFLKGGATAFH